MLCFVHSFKSHTVEIIAETTIQHFLSVTQLSLICIDGYVMSMVVEVSIIIVVVYWYQFLQ